MEYTVVEADKLPIGQMIKETACCDEAVEQGAACKAGVLYFLGSGVQATGVTGQLGHPQQPQGYTSCVEGCMLRLYCVLRDTLAVAESLGSLKVRLTDGCFIVKLEDAFTSTVFII